MKLLLIFFLTLIPGVSGVSGVFAQEPAVEKWSRLEMENHELSVVFPPGFLVDATAKKKSGQVAQLFGFGDEFSVSLTVIKDPNANSRLSGVADLADHYSKTFTVNGFNGKRQWTWEMSPTMHEVVHLASDRHFYTLSIYARDINRPDVQRILYGITINGKPLYAQIEKKSLPETEPVVIETLRSSPEVIDAYGRKYEKRNIKISYEPMSAFKEDIKLEKNKRPAAILERGQLSKYLSRELFPSGNGVRHFTAKLRVNLLANGEVGDITVFSDDPRGYQEACVERTRRAKFVPAAQGGINVDMVLTDSCTGSIMVSTGLFR